MTVPTCIACKCELTLITLRDKAGECCPSLEMLPLRVHDERRVIYLFFLCCILAGILLGLALVKLL